MYLEINRKYLPLKKANKPGKQQFLQEIQKNVT